MDTVTAGSAYSFTPTVANTRTGSTLKFWIANKPSWAAFNTSTGALTGTPGSSQSGSYAGIVINASDRNASASLPAFSITVSPAPPLPTVTSPAQGQAHVVVPAESSAQFSQANATWSLAPGSAGTITPSGLYTAPAHVDPVRVVNGVQILPTDHIYYAKITNLPLIPNEATILSVMHANPGPYVGSGVSLIPYFHTDVLDDSIPSIPMTFLYTGKGSVISFNGQYQFMSGNDPESPYVGVSGEFIENGTYLSYRAPEDRHIFGTNRDSGISYEVYNSHPPGSDSRNPATNAVSGSYYGLTVNPYTIGPATVAGGQLLSAGLITADEIRTHKIHHVSFFTLPNGTIAGGSKCGNPPAVVQCFIWPATARAYAGGSYVPYGARFRLKASVDTVNNPATGKPFSPEAQAVFQAWKDYGVMLSDGGINGQNEIDVDVLEDHALGIPLLWEVNHSKATDGLKVGDWTHWDVVDESSLELPGGALSGRVNQANHYVHPVFATAIATDKTSHAQTAHPIILQGVTVGVPHSVETIQSGMRVQMESWVRGTLNPNVHWTMSPALGTLTSAGLYTAPAATSPQSTLMTVTSAADPQASTTVRVTVFPAGGVYMRMAPAGSPYGATPYTDTEGHVWQTEFTGRIGYTQPNNYLQYGTGGSAPGTKWPANLTDWPIWQWRERPYGVDMYFRIQVPNGAYTVTLYNGIGGVRGTLAPHVSEFAIECMGKIIDPDYDLSVKAGGKTGVPLTYTMTANVTNGVLTFAERRLFVGTESSGPTPALGLNAFSIVPK